MNNMPKKQPTREEVMWRMSTMKSDINTQRKINAFLGRKSYEMFSSQAEFEAAYAAWRKHIEEEDEARFAAAIESANPHARVVTKTWPFGGFHLRRGNVVYVKVYPTGPMVTRTNGSMQGMVGKSNWSDINEHTMLVRDAKREFATVG